MLAYILFQRKLSKIKRRKKRDEGAIKTALTDAKTKELPIDEISNLENDYGHIQVQYLDEILRLHTEYLIRESTGSLFHTRPLTSLGCGNETMRDMSV